MIKHISIFAFSFLFASFAHAQFSYGLKAGGAQTSLPGDFVDEKKVGFFAGITGAMELKKSFSLRAELYYSAQGNKKTVDWGDVWDPVQGYSSSGTKGELVYRLNYLNLPIMLKYRHKTGFFAEAGPQAGLLISSKVKTPRAVSDINDIYRTFDLSWVAGAGYQLANGLGVNFRYNRSVLGVYKKDQYLHYYKPHNTVLQLGLFYSWKKK